MGFFTGDFASWIVHFVNICVKNQQMQKLCIQIATHHVAINNAPIYNILPNAPQLSISQKALETFPEDGNVMPKHVVATIHN
jgi:hypothetical protein